MEDDKMVIWLVVAVVVVVLLKRSGTSLGSLFGSSTAQAAPAGYTYGGAGGAPLPPAYVPGQVNPTTGVYSPSGQFTERGTFIDPQGSGSAFANSGWGAFGKGGVFDQVNTELVKAGLRPDSTGMFREPPASSGAPSAARPQATVQTPPPAAAPVSPEVGSRAPTSSSGPFGGLRSVGAPGNTTSPTDVVGRLGALGQFGKH